MFTTNPLQEFMDLSNNCQFYGHQNQPVCCSAKNMGLFEAAKNSKKVGIIVAGSDASNDFSGNKDGVILAYATKSGFSGNTGNLMKGARIVRINLHQGILWSTTWTRDSEGTVET